MTTLAPTAAGLVTRAINDHDAVTQIEYAAHMDTERALLIALRTVADAVTDWARDNHATDAAVTADIRDEAARIVFDLAWDALDRKQLADMAEDEACMGRTWARAQYFSDRHI